MLTSLYYARSFKWMLPAGVMLGTAPTFFSSWSIWRLITIPLPFRVYEKGDELAYTLYQRLVLFFYENWTGVKIILYGDFEEILQKKENVIFISNHQSTVDWVIADMIAERQGTLGNIRYILKDGLKYFPLYGFYFRQHSCIYVERGGKFKEGKAIRHLDTIRDHKTPFWMVLFPEGTRYNPNHVTVISKSENYAQKEGIKPYKHHLTPRVKALFLCLSRLRDVTDAVYDITAAYDNTSLENGKRTNAAGLSEFLGGACSELHIHIKRIPIHDIPKEEEKVKYWLYDRFHEKDRLLERYYSAGSGGGTLGEGGRHHRLGLQATLPAFLLWTAINIPIFGTSVGRELYWKSALCGMALGWGWMAVSS